MPSASFHHRGRREGGAKEEGILGGGGQNVGFVQIIFVCSVSLSPSRSLFFSPTPPMPKILKRACLFLTGACCASYYIPPTHQVPALSSHPPARPSSPGAFALEALECHRAATTRACLAEEFQRRQLEVQLTQLSPSEVVVLYITLAASHPPPSLSL